MVNNSSQRFKALVGCACVIKLPQPCDRIEVSSDFFRSPEFQDRGYFIFRFYIAALGRNTFYNEFIPDLAKVSGFQTNAELEASKVAFVNDFASRPEFKAKYDQFTTPTAYVDALLQTAGLPNHPLRGAWISLLTNGQATRNEVLRGLMESKEVYDKFYNTAFVRHAVLRIPPPRPGHSLLGVAQDHRQ